MRERKRYLSSDYFSSLLLAWFDSNEMEHKVIFTSKPRIVCQLLSSELLSAIAIYCVNMASAELVIDKKQKKNKKTNYHSIYVIDYVL